jgi:hypothetical protein
MARRLIAALAIITIVGVLLLLMLEVTRHRRGAATDESSTVALAVHAA